MILRLCLSFCLLAWGAASAAEENGFALEAPERLVDTGFLDYLLPRFSLKTGVRITLNGSEPQARLTEDTGVPVFQNEDTAWHFDHAPTPQTDRFLDWLQSEIGARTIAAYQPEGTPPFTPLAGQAEATEPTVPDADTEAGERLSLALCGRCHVVNDKNRMKAIGSTPSFAVLRTLAGWVQRFEAFYVLKPHAAFTQIEDVTPPFDPARPSPIVPIEMTLEDLDAILAYVGTVPPADLGAPIQSQ